MTHDNAASTLVRPTAGTSDIAVQLNTVISICVVLVVFLIIIFFTSLLQGRSKILKVKTGATIDHGLI